VLQADGGTRTAAITGAYVALVDAVRWLQKRGDITRDPIHGAVAAVSVGIYPGVPVLDLDYAEDSDCDTDMNVVMNDGGGFIELQGTAEGHAFRREELDAPAGAGPAARHRRRRSGFQRAAPTPAPEAHAMARLVLASGNAGKLAELRALLARQPASRCTAQGELGIGDIEETGLSFVENALLKARHAAAPAACRRWPTTPACAWTHWAARPGLYSARYAGPARRPCRATSRSCWASAEGPWPDARAARSSQRARTAAPSATRSR
jgi:hypothetical protein